MGLGRGIRSCSTVALASRLFGKDCGLSLGVAPKRSSLSKISNCNMFLMYGAIGK